MKKMLWTFVFVLLGSVILSSLIISRTVNPSPDTRVVLEHTYRTYIAPLCFETADATNFLEESTLENSRTLDYKPHSACTEEALEAENNSLFISLLKEIRIMDKKWDNW
jgi:hypothetical protein